MLESIFELVQYGGADVLSEAFNNTLDTSLKDYGMMSNASKDHTFYTDSLSTSNSLCYSFHHDNPSIGVSLENNTSTISFGSNIDDLYDPQIQSAHDDVMYHSHAAENARSYDDLINHRHEETSAVNSERYWIDSKFDTENEQMKIEAEHEYQDYLYEQYSISHVEDIYNDVHGNNPERSFGSSENHLTDDGRFSISFQGYQENSRDISASELQNKLSYHRIYYPGSLSSDNTFGGWDRYTGQKIHDAIQNARNSGIITDDIYKELMRELKKACYYQQ